MTDDVHGTSPSVGQRKSRTPTNFRDLTGQVFSRLTVIDRAPDFLDQKGRSRVRWRCVCECQRVIIVRSDHLYKGTIRSCGCLRADVLKSLVGVCRYQFQHGNSRTREYQSWNQARQRTTNPKNHKYPSYGGRGIRMAEEWIDDFPAFFQHMGFRPPGTTLDRIDNNRGYEPGNCRWATAKEQARNTRNNVLIEIDGLKKTAGEWSEVSGIPEERIRTRISRDCWDAKRAVFSPLKR